MWLNFHPLCTNGGNAPCWQHGCTAFKLHSDTGPWENLLYNHEETIMFNYICNNTTSCFVSLVYTRHFYCTTLNKSTACNRLSVLLLVTLGLSLQRWKTRNPWGKPEHVVVAVGETVCRVQGQWMWWVELTDLFHLVKIQFFQACHDEKHRENVTVHTVKTNAAVWVGLNLKKVWLLHKRWVKEAYLSLCVKKAAYTPVTCLYSNLGVGISYYSHEKSFWLTKHL